MRIVEHIRRHAFGLLLFGALTLAPCTLMAQEAPCDEVLGLAEQAFFNALFEEARSSIAHCMDDPIFEDDEVRAKGHLLLSRIYFAEQSSPEARSHLFTLLDLDPEFILSRPLPPPFIKFFEEVSAQHYDHAQLLAKLRPAPDFPRSRGLYLNLKDNWYWIGGGALLAGTAMALINDSDRPTVFPTPPAPPR